MSYQFLQSESVEEGVRRIVCEEIDSALEEINDKSLDRHEVVHSVRKTCKKVRGILRLARGAMPQQYQLENQCFRDAARMLSAIRDAHVLTNTAATFLEQFPDQLAPETRQQLLMLLDARKERVLQSMDMEARLDEFRCRVENARKRANDWEIPLDRFDALEPGLRKTYSRGYRSMILAYEGSGKDEHFHEWRKRVKYHWYHMRVLNNVWPSVFTVIEQHLDELGDVLGLEHDLFVLAEVLSEELELSENLRQKDHILDLIQQRRKVLQQQARKLGHFLFAERPNAIAKRYRRYWNIWREEDNKSQPRLAI